MSWLRLALHVLSVGATLPPLVVAASALSGLGHRWPDLLVQFTAPALLATLVLTLVLGLFRLWPGLALGLVASSLLLIAAWPQWFPPRDEARPGSTPLTLYSANVLWDNADVAAMSRSIAEAQPDVVILIELGNEAADQIETLLPRHPHRIQTRPFGRDGKTARSVVASRWPLQPIARAPDGLHALGAVVQTPDGPVNVVGAHLTRPWPYQYQWGQITQVMALTELRRGLAGPVIVAGDFNSVSTGRIGRQVRDDMKLIPAPGFPGTWPTRLPSFLGVTIDQVWRSPDLALLDRRLGLPNGSDHRPVVTRFAYAAS